MIPPRIVIATSNAHKVEELRELAKLHSVDTKLYSWSELATPIDIEETGSTFEENAYIKAIAVHEQTGMPVIADDSGLEVDALDCAPGVRSARYAGEQATDLDNRKKLLHELLRHDGKRIAGFRCVLCYTDGQRTVFGEGSVKGHITHEERGENGFGYDPLFIPESDTRTFAEMQSHEKHAYSHRSRAFRNLIKNMEGGTASKPPQVEFLIQAAIGAATNNEPLLRTSVRNAVTTTDDALLVYEAVLQTYLFAGYPAALDGLTIVAEECQELLGSPMSHAVAPFDVALFRERGTTLCRTIYGNVYDKLMTRLDAVSPDLKDWMIVEGYGKTLSRPALDVITRELCIVGVLAVTGRTTQLYSHVRGAMLAGASPSDLALCVDAVTECDTARHADNIRSIIKSFTS